MCPDMISLQPVCSGLIGQTIFGILSSQHLCLFLLSSHSTLKWIVKIFHRQEPIYPTSKCWDDPEAIVSHVRTVAESHEKFSRKV